MIQQPPTRDHMTREQVKAARAQLGMSQAEFGRALGLSRKTIQAYEGGTLWPSRASEEKIRLLTSTTSLRKYELRAKIDAALTAATVCRERADIAGDPDERAMYQSVTDLLLAAQVELEQ